MDGRQDEDVQENSEEEGDQAEQADQEDQDEETAVVPQKRRLSKTQIAKAKKLKISGIRHPTTDIFSGQILQCRTWPTFHPAARAQCVTVCTQVTGTGTSLSTKADSELALLSFSVLEFWFIPRILLTAGNEVQLQHLSLNENVLPINFADWSPVTSQETRERFLYSLVISSIGRCALDPEHDFVTQKERAIGKQVGDMIHAINGEQFWTENADKFAQMKTKTILLPPISSPVRKDFINSILTDVSGVSVNEFREELKRIFNEKASNKNYFDRLFRVIEYHASIKDDKKTLGELSTELNLHEWTGDQDPLVADYNLLVCIYGKMHVRLASTDITTTQHLLTLELGKQRVGALVRAQSRYEMDDLSDLSEEEDIEEEDGTTKPKKKKVLKPKTVVKKTRKTRRQKDSEGETSSEDDGTSGIVLTDSDASDCSEKKGNKVTEDLDDEHESNIPSAKDELNRLLPQRCARGGFTEVALAFQCLWKRETGMFRHHQTNSSPERLYLVMKTVTPDKPSAQIVLCRGAVRYVYCVRMDMRLCKKFT
jgi:hypothetical protein